MEAKPAAVAKTAAEMGTALASVVAARAAEEVDSKAAAMVDTGYLAVVAAASLHNLDSSVVVA